MLNQFYSEILMNNDLATIQHYCASQQIKLTAQQELVLSTISKNDHPPTIAQILAELVKDNPKANRMTIHRALEYLTTIGLIHKIALNHTYALCSNFNQFHHQSCQILICQKCGTQIEIHSHKICEALAEAASSNDFSFISPLEIIGLCYRCQQLV